MTNSISQMDVNEQLDLLKSILDSSTEYSIAASDLEGTILAWNIGAKKMYGYEASEVIGKNASIFFPKEDSEFGVLKNIFAEVREKETWTGEMSRVRKDGSQFNAFVTVTLRRDANNIPVGFTAITRDLTEIEENLSLLKKLKSSEEILKIKYKELEETTLQAQEASQLKSEFMANVSHEIRTPLNGIIGFAELIRNGLVDPSSPKYDEFLKNIIVSAKQLLTLINALLDLAKTDAHKIDFFPEKINLERLLLETNSMFDAQIIHKHIQFETNIIPPLKEIILDADKLKQVLYNLISNAIKFTPDGGKISITICEKTPKRFCIEVKDTGIGISEEDLPKLFERFTQLDTGLGKKYTGTGLGLALVKSIVEAQGGQIGVKSVLREGSEFFVFLPYRDETRLTSKHLKLNSQDVEKINVNNILFIREDSTDQELIEDTLLKAGYTVNTANNTEMALKSDQSQNPDAIILDLFLPYTTQITQLFTANHNKLNFPILATFMVEQPACFAFGIHNFLLKPVLSQQLLAALEMAGVSSDFANPILILDNDQKQIALAKKIFSAAGFRVITRTTRTSTLSTLEREHPAMILVDPFMSGMEGFEFLRSYSKTKYGVNIPVIMWTTAELSDEERSYLKASIQQVLFKGMELRNQILTELQRYLPLSRD